MTSTWLRMAVTAVGTLALAATSWASGDVLRERPDALQKKRQAPTGITKPNDAKINLKGQDPGSGRQHDVGTHGIDDGQNNRKTLKKDDDGGGLGGATGAAQDIKDKATIHDARYGDTFGAGRINDRNQGDINLGHGAKGPDNFTGGGRGRASEGGLAEQHGGVASSSENKNADGGTTTVTTYKDGASRAWTEDKSGNVTKVIDNGADGSQKISTWNNTTKSWDTTKTNSGGLPDKTKTPNPDADTGPQRILVTPGSQGDKELRLGGNSQGQAGGRGDGRNPDAGTTGGTSEHSATSVQMGITKGQEAREVLTGGTLNMDKVLEINQKVNPGAR